MVTANERLEALAKEAAELEQKTKKLVALHVKFPDLRIHTNRWKKERYSASSVNAIVEHAEFTYNCGCCPDSPLEVWPYIEFEGERIYSDPCGIMVADKGYDWGDTPYAEWNTKITNAGINEAIVKLAKERFKAQRQEHADELREEMERLDDAD